MNVNEMTLEQIENRKAEIEEMLEQSDSNLDGLEEELRMLKDRKAELAEERQQIIEEVLAEETPIIEETRGNKKMEKTLKEVLQSEEYINAYARYIKNDDDKEVRSLLTELTDNGVVPVPSYLEPRINTAWENEQIIARANKTYVKGIIRQGIEVSATDAVFHTEGATKPDEEVLVIGVVTITPRTIKKWITISDEVLDMTGREFLDYIFDEIEYKLAKKASYEIVKAIATSPTAYVADADGKYTSAKVLQMIAPVAANSILVARGILSDEARNPVVIMNKRTEVAFKSLMTADGYAVKDPFDGLPVLHTDYLESYADCDNGDIFAIVGDMSAIRVNFPNGMGVQFKYDDMSLAEYDLNKIVGRMPIGIGVVASDRFVLIKKGTLSY